MSRAIPRYASSVPLPDQPYLPGRTPRPPEGAAHHPSSDDLSTAIEYLHGVDLFNHGCYWEAHEAWESLWLPLHRDSEDRQHLQGLIQASAALLKLRLGEPEPARTIWSRGRIRLVEIAANAPDGVHLRVSLPTLVDEVDRVVAAGVPAEIPPRITLR